MTPDPILAAIAEHKALAKEYVRCRDIFQAAHKKAERKLGQSLEGAALQTAAAEATSTEYDRFNCAADAEEAAAQRMAKTRPTTNAGAAALIAHVRREIIGSSDIIDDEADWQMIALKTVASALTRGPYPE